MDERELEALGMRIALKIAAGIAKGAEAGADVFAAQMDEVGRRARLAREDRESEALEAEALRIETERTDLTKQLADATGLKAVVIRKKIDRLNALESELAASVGTTTPTPAPALETLQATPQDATPRTTRWVPLHEVTNGKH